MYLREIFLLAFIVQTSAIGVCYSPGPAFPPVDHILISTHFNQLSVKLDEVIKNVLKTPEGWTTNTSSFAVQVTSSKKTIWSSYYTAPILGEYEDSEPSAVGGDTAFRVASISKTFTVYAVLLENKINLEDPITKYLPELLGGERNDQHVQWDQITIRSLASQLSGISRETGLEDLAAATDWLPDPVASGFPPVDEESMAPCMKNATDRACKASDIIEVAIKRSKVFMPNDRSTYSNVAFSLLGMVLEKVTGKSYTSIISHSILIPLGMEHTRTTKPKDSDGIIPWGPNDWAQELGADTPSGGIYSTPNDFSKYLRSVLTSSLLPRATINAWMKPHSWTSSGSSSAYGMPFEILRTTKGTPDQRPIDIITKGGALTGYFSTIALLPEFGLGVTVLVAGDTAAQFDLRERVLAALIPAVDTLLRGEVSRSYCGLYAGWDDKDSILRLEVDDHGPGLKITEWKSNGVDFLAVYGRLKHMPSDLTRWEAHLLPTGVMSQGEDSEDGNWDVWRFTAVPKKIDSQEKKLFEDYCMTDVDTLMYSGVSIEEVIIAKGPGGNGRRFAEVVKLSGLRTSLFRWEDCDGRELVLGPGASANSGVGKMLQRPLGA